MFSLDGTEAGVCFGVAGAGLQAVGRIAYGDDAVLPAIAPAAVILNKIMKTAEVVDSTYESFGLALNFQPGKSECLIRFHGDGSKHLRK